MKKIKNFEIRVIILLILTSIFLGVIYNNGIYLFLGVLYSIIIFLTFLFPRRKNKNLSKKQIINLSIISFIVIISITILLGVLVVLGIKSFANVLVENL